MVVLSKVYLSFYWLSFRFKSDAPFYCADGDNSPVNWDNLCDHQRDVPWVDVCKVNTSAGGGGEFCEYVQVGIDTHILYHKFQAQNKPSLWFPAACAAVIPIKIASFVFINRINTLHLNWSLDKVKIIRKGFPKLSTLHMLINETWPGWLLANC